MSRLGDQRCDGILRRDILHVGGLTAFGLTLSDWFSASTSFASAAAQASVPAESCILIWLDGGPSHLETFDLKPNAPAEVRGPLRPMATSVPSIQISEYFPQTARLMDHVALVRSMTSTLGEHNFASHYLLTGYKPTPALTYPSVPAVTTHLSASRAALPRNVAVPAPNSMAGVGYLPDSAAPFVIDGDPSAPDFRVRDLSPPAGLSGRRMGRRQRFRDAVDRFSEASEAHLKNAPHGESAFEQAFQLIQSPQARSAFDLDQESAETRQRYGRHQIGQSCLLARRLIEAGSRFVTVTDRGWDTHDRLFNRLKEGFTGGTAGKIPKLDVAYSALLEDLAQRGMLDSTLVILMGEFGRTPKLNTRGGRDHWPRAFSVAMAGGGVRGGQAVGRSDAHGEAPAERPVSPADLVRTVYHLLGIDPKTHLHTADGRPVQVNRDGVLVDELLA